MADRQIEMLLTALHEVLGDDAVGGYLHGSAVLGGLRPHSDLDVMAVSKRHTTRKEKGQLGARLIALSCRPRPVELTIVVEDEIRPWRYPPQMDFQYGDWWRDEFERGNFEPWPSRTNPDLAPLIRMVLNNNTPLFGPQPSEIFDPVPRRDYVDALVRGIDAIMEDVESDTRNVVLTMARIWRGTVTDDVCAKDIAADWALARLPAPHRPVLARARAIYLGDEEDRWTDLLPEARALVEHLAAEVRRSQSELGSF